MNQTISDLEGRLRTSEDSRHQLEDVSAELKAQLFAANDRVKSLETDLRIEKEWRSQATTSLQVTIDDAIDDVVFRFRSIVRTYAMLG